MISSSFVLETNLWEQQLSCSSRYWLSLPCTDAFAEPDGRLPTPMHNLFSVLPSSLETGEGTSSLPLSFPCHWGWLCKTSGTWNRGRGLSDWCWVQGKFVLFWEWRKKKKKKEGHRWYSFSTGLNVGTIPGSHFCDQEWRVHSTVESCAQASLEHCA